MASAAVVAPRLCDLLMQFPSAAIGGVRWRVLVKRYEERFGGKLDIAALGHTSAVTAATALLWDVLRLVSSDDAENPMVAIEDCVALTPRPGFIGTWPSLYATLHDIVQDAGTLEAPSQAEAAAGVQVRVLLLSQLKPLLQGRWHASFDDYGLGYLSDEGAFLKLKKMKHLVQAVLRWRDQRVEQREATGSKLTEVDRALQPRIELVASKSHNDLVLRCPVVATPPAAIREERPASRQIPETTFPVQEEVSGFRAAEAAAAAADEALKRELAELRAENAALRRTNEQLLHNEERDHHSEPLLFTLVRDEFDDLESDVFDDPFEPPPQALQSWGYSSASSSCSSPVHAAHFASFEALSGATTHASMTPSGAMTPVASASLGDKVCALVPMWFCWTSSGVSLMGDRGKIPSGIVDKIRAQFETARDGYLAQPVYPTREWRLL